MRFTVKILFPGFSGKLSTGYMGWGTWAYITDGNHKIMLDTGFVGLRKDYPEILSQNGIKAEEIDTVLLTHLHFDHAVNVDQYPNATFIISQQEWEYAHDPNCQDRFIEQAALSALRYKKVRLVQDGETVLPGITAMLTPGHTPGCCTYLLHQDNGEIWALVGDAAKNRKELALEGIQMTLNREQTINSIQKIRKTANRILPGHDGWLRIKDGKIIPENENIVKLIFGQGITVNHGQKEIAIRMD